MKLEPSLEELLQIDEIISSFSEEELLEMGHRLNRFEWPDALGSAPEGFEEMIPGLKLFHIDPWAMAIELHTSKKARLRYVHTRELGRSEEQFEDWWQSEMFQMMENIQGECESKKTGEPPDDIKMVLQKDAAKKREQVRKDCKKYLKYTVCSLFGLSVFLLSESLLGGLVLLGLFILRILLEE